MPKRKKIHESLLQSYHNALMTHRLSWWIICFSLLVRVVKAITAVVVVIIEVVRLAL
jgi:hypothetical protein